MATATRFFMETFGCQMNVHDSEKLQGFLQQKGWLNVSDPADSDVIILNTCSVRVKAEHKVLSRIGRLQFYRKHQPDLCVAVIGCMAQAWGPKLLDMSKQVDIVLGPGAIWKIYEYYMAGNWKKTPEVDVEEPDSIFTLEPGNLPLPRHHSTFFTIMEGCNNFCSYCIVPFVRGRERSLPSREIIEEITALVERGVREVTLLGQNVNSYQGCDDGFPGLLEKVHAIEGLHRIRFTTSHPKDISESLAETVSHLPKVCNYFHFPAQTGSTKILQRMNRGYTREDYLGKVKMIRDMIPEVALSSDIIVGFPGERDDDFNETVSLIESVQFDNVFAFRYSVRPGTAAAEFDDDVPLGVKAKRLDEIIALQRDISIERNREWIGRDVEVLVEGPDKRGKKQSGRTQHNRIVNFFGDAQKGTLVIVRIDDATPNCLYGKQL
jgi:tRNA-2-methylthio-N6-dimethylallyladenosine synthase